MLVNDSRSMALPTVREMIRMGYFVDVSTFLSFRSLPASLVVMTMGLHDQCRSPRAIDNLFMVGNAHFQASGDPSARFKCFGDTGSVIDIKAAVCTDGKEIFVIADLEGAAEAGFGMPSMN
jgi:hypothetical protein